jgi:hypothetical protein
MITIQYIASRTWALQWRSRFFVPSGLADPVVEDGGPLIHNGGEEEQRSFDSTALTVFDGNGTVLQSTYIPGSSASHALALGPDSTAYVVAVPDASFAPTQQLAGSRGGPAPTVSVSSCRTLSCAHYSVISVATVARVPMGARQQRGSAYHRAMVQGFRVDRGAPRFKLESPDS